MRSQPCGLGEQTFAPTANGAAAGALCETFVTTEVFKHATWSERSVDLSYFRDRDGAEVDLIVEDRWSGGLAGIEIRLTSTPTSRHARHLAMLRDKLGDRFKTGLVIHAGPQTLPLGDPGVGCSCLCVCAFRRVTFTSRVRATP
jgi:predicted AAA+ superfamily ATPase